MLMLRRLIHLVLFLAVAICQVPGSVFVGRCEMACCKPEVTEQPHFQEKASCCCASTVVHKHVVNDAASPTSITGDFESLAVLDSVQIPAPDAVLVNREPIPYANGPPGLAIVWLPPTRAPPVS